MIALGAPAWVVGGRPGDDGATTLDVKKPLPVEPLSGTGPLDHSELGKAPSRAYGASLIGKPGAPFHVWTSRMGEVAPDRTHLARVTIEPTADVWDLRIGARGLDGILVSAAKVKRTTAAAGSPVVLDVQVAARKAVAGAVVVDIQWRNEDGEQTATWSFAIAATGAMRALRTPGTIVADEAGQPVHLLPATR